MKEYIPEALVILKKTEVYVGPLCSHINDFAALLSKQGYAIKTIEAKIRLVGDFSRWLHQKKQIIDGLNEQAIDTFMLFRMSQGRRARRGNRATLHMLLEHLHDIGVIPLSIPVVENSMLHQIEFDFTQYLLHERGLCQTTVDNYLPEIRDFLIEHFDPNTIHPNKLNASDIHTFILNATSKVSHGRLKLIGTALRVFLRYLLLRGEIDTNLAAAVPTPSQWRFSNLPKFLEPKQVETVLKSCDQSTTVGQRDYTVLLLLSRLGLRAGEVVAMTLDDVDWEVGELNVRGKGCRQERLPIPFDVGNALATYLRYGRPQSSQSLTRRIFIRIKAPHQGFSSSVAICNIVRRALLRSGIQSAHKGAHLFRHSLATRMIREGATLNEIGEILRHRLPSTTEIYAKIDTKSLRALALPWPGGEL